MKKRIIILLLIILLSGCTKENKIIDNQKQEEYQTSIFKIVDYTIYHLEDDSFDFAIVKIRIKDNKNVNYQLSDITTSENISLDTSYHYQQELIKKGYNLDNYNLSSDLASAAKSAIFNVLVPILDNKQDQITLSFLKDNQDVIDLNKNQEILKNNHNEQTISKNDYQIIIKNAYSTLGETVYQYNETYDFSSNSEIYAIKIILISLNNTEIEIQNAYFINDNERIKALDSSFRTERTNNILNQKTADQKEGYLLFEIIDPNKLEQIYLGELELIINNQIVKVKFEL